MCKWEYPSASKQLCYWFRPRDLTECGDSWRKEVLVGCVLCQSLQLREKPHAVWFYNRFNRSVSESTIIVILAKYPRVNCQILASYAAGCLAESDTRKDEYKSIIILDSASSLRTPLRKFRHNAINSAYHTNFLGCMMMPAVAGRGHRRSKAILYESDMAENVLLTQKRTQVTSAARPVESKSPAF